MTLPAPAISVLVADDDDEMRALIRLILESEDYAVIAVDSGEAAVEAARRSEFPLAIIDLRMPGIDGIETLRRLKEINPAIEVIIATGQGSEEVAEQVSAAGAFAYVVKPFHPEELKALLPSAREKFQLRSLVGLYEFTREIYTDLKLNELIPHLIPLGRKILDADDASLILRDPEGVLRVMAISGLEPNSGRIGTEVKLGSGVAGRVAQWHSGVIIAGTVQSDPRFQDLPARPGIGSALVYPITSKDELIGILTANRKEGRPPFGSMDLRNAAIFCSHANQALTNARLYEKLEAAKKAAEKRSALKDELIDITVHDLKSPLVVIMGFAEFLMNRTDDEETKTGLNKIRKTAETMSTMIRRLLGKSIMQSPELEVDRSPTDIGPIILDCLKDIALVARKKGIRFVQQSRLPEDVLINVDGGMLIEIATNLVGNAVKYAGEGSLVQVTLEAKNGDFILKVADNGPGITPKDQERIFEKFQRGGVTQAEGAGYGLSIVRRFAELHGGQVLLNSAPGEGAAFTVSFPNAVVK